MYLTNLNFCISESNVYHIFLCGKDMSVEMNTEIKNSRIVTKKEVVLALILCTGSFLLTTCMARIQSPMSKNYATH